MGELRALLMLELRSLYGINKARYTKDQKEKRRFIAMTVAWVLVAAVACFYVGALVFGLCMLDMAQIVPAYLCVLASLLILVFGLFVAGNRIFGDRSYDILASLPVTPGALVLSRFLSLYIEDMVFAAVILVPGMAVYGYLCRPSLWVYLVALAGVLLIPAIPLVLSVLFGTGILAITAGMKRKSLAQSVLMVLFVFAVLLGSFAIGPATENITQAQLVALAGNIGNLLGKLYPPAQLFLSASQGSALSLLLYGALSVAVIGMMIWLVSANYSAIMSRLMAFSGKHNYRLGQLERRNLLKTLYLREIKRYFASSIYVTNTIIGPIMGAMMAIALCVSGEETIQKLFPVPLDLSILLPFVFSAIFCMMNTTSVSVSMEGKEIWIAKSLPIPPKVWLDSKLLLNLSLMLPCYLISEIAFVIGLKPDGLSLLWLILIPASVMVLSVVLSLTVNLKIHSFDWEKEETVVKQSLPAMLGGFSGFLIAAGCGLLVVVLPPSLREAAKAVVCLLMWAITAWLYYRNNKIRMALL